MKHSIEGFSQPAILKLGLDIKDVIVLRWMVDFQTSGRMEVLTSEDRQWYWIHPPKIGQELPVLGIMHQKVWARRLRRMEASGVLKLLQSGGKTYFRLVGEAMMELISDAEKQKELFSRAELKSSSRNPNGQSGTQKFQKRNSKVPETELKSSRLYNDSSINDSSIIDSKQPVQKKVPAPSFQKPVENSKTVHSAEFLRKAEEAKEAGFNIFELVNRFYKQSRLSEPLPEDVLDNVLDEFLLRGRKVEEMWPYFWIVLKAKSGRHFAAQNERAGQEHKKEPAVIGMVLAGMMAGKT